RGRIIRAMPLALRIAFDMDGTLADLKSAYAEVERLLFGAADDDAESPAPEVREAEQHDAESSGQDPSPRPERTRAGAGRFLSPQRENVWQKIEATPDFWTTLKPIEKGAVERLYALTGELNWEVFFVTQRPATAGRTVQWQ